MNPEKKRIKWNIEDISSAISLRSVSPKAYRYLRKKNYPLPGLSTLRKWATRLNLEEGILKDVISLMREKGKSISAFQKIYICFSKNSRS